MPRILLLILLLIALAAHAEDTLVAGGESPDGRYQLRIYKTDSRAPSDYFYGVFDTQKRKVVKELAEGGGIANYEGAKEIAKVLWHSSSRFFALTDHGTRHSVEMYIYAIRDTEVTLLEQPNYFQNALGRVDSTEGYMTVVVKPLQWKQDDLSCSMIFDARTKDSSREMYTVDFNLKLRHGDAQSPQLEFASMGKPKHEE
jgi:hypothetical protein